MVEAPLHPNALEMASKLNIDTRTNSMVRKKLGLSSTGERQFDILPTEILERHYGKYSQSAKALRNRDIPDPFFRDIAKFMLEVGCVHLNAYGMPKHRTINIRRHGCRLGDHHGCSLRGGLHAFHSRKKLRPIIQQYLTILFPPRTLPALATRPS